MFRNPELAATLRLLGEKGPGEFYKGGLARKIVEAVRAKGGVMTLDDLAAYEPREVEPLRGAYKGAVIYTVPPPATGGLHVLQFLAILEEWPVGAWGFGSPSYIHHSAEAFRFIFADHHRYLGDPEHVRIPVQALLSRDYARSIAAKVRPEATAGSYPFTVLDAPPEGSGSTTHLAVVDKDGNIAAVTQSIEAFFGSGIVPGGAGFLLNNQMGDFGDPGTPNAPGPGRRPSSSMGPMILFKDGAPFLVLGSPGGLRIFPTLAQIIVNILDFGMGLDAAIEAPRFFASSARGRALPLAIESRVSEGVRAVLEKLGHKITLKEEYDKYFGGAQGLMILGNPRRIRGGADSRRDGAGAGY
jgi:gamma-glutamyltranspeptidase/glutathione hydrolase